MHEMSGADALLAQVLANGIDTVYGLPGGQLDHFFDAMHRAGKRIRFIGSRHEQGAAYMAWVTRVPRAIRASSAWFPGRVY